MIMALCMLNYYIFKDSLESLDKQVIEKMEYDYDLLFNLSTFNDLGLLGAKVDITAKEVLTGMNYLSEYKGAFTEQFVAGELISADYCLYYHSKENSSLEIDFTRTNGFS